MIFDNIQCTLWQIPMDEILMEEKSARSATKRFHSNVTKFHAFLARFDNCKEIEERTKSLIKIADHNELELTTWLKLVKCTPEEKIIIDLISTIQDAIEGCRRAALYKINAIEKDEITCVQSATSHKTSRMSFASQHEIMNLRIFILRVKICKCETFSIRPNPAMCKGP